MIGTRSLTGRSNQETLVRGGYRWHLAPGFPTSLLGPDGLPLDDWRAAGRAEVVKQGPHRTVYRVNLPETVFYLKHFRISDRRAWCREWLRPSKARIEYDRCHEVAARGLPTVTPLLLGESVSNWPGESYLATRAILGTEPLSTFLEKTLPSMAEPRQSRIRQRMAGVVGEFLSRMHDSGVRHDDLHPANLLVRLEDEEPSLWLIDLHAVRVGAPLSDRARRNNLLLINRWFLMRATRSDRRRAWQAYRSKTLLEVRDIEDATLASNKRFWVARDARCLEANRYYRPVQSPVAVGHVVADLDPQVLAPLLEDPDAPFRRPGISFLKDSPSSTVVELEIRVGDQTVPAIYKRLRATSRDACLSLLRRPPALRSWVYGHGLRERCLPSPRPLMVLHRRRLGLLQDGYLLVEKVPNARQLDQHLAELAKRPVEARQESLRILLERVAQLIRAMHERGLAHRDLKAPNILISGEASDPRLWFIDLVGMSCPRRLSVARRQQNLARLQASFRNHPALTRTDRVRFLRVYLAWGLHGKEGWKGWWRTVEQATLRKVAQNRRNCRPLA